jgi:cardiolipin synthase
MILLKKVRISYLFLFIGILINTQAAKLYACGEDSLVKAKLWTFPEAKRDPFLEAIKGAEKTIQIAVYKLSDPALINALKEAAQRNVKIEILYEPSTYQHNRQEVQDSNLKPLEIYPSVRLYTHSDRFNQVHHKLLLIDGKKAIIGTINFDSESFDGVMNGDASTRDFAIETENPKVLEELKHVFEADLKDSPAAYHHPALVWGPHTQRTKILQLIEKAQESIDIYQQDIQDKGIQRALLGALKRGIKVRLIMMPYPFDKHHQKDGNIPHQNELIQKGGHVGLYKALYVHAKALLIDGENPTKAQLYVGSTNFYTPSLDENRELGIIVTDPTPIAEFQRVFSQDWLKCEKDVLRK